MKSAKTTSTQCNQSTRSYSTDGDVRMATVSDIHLGHPRTNTFHITANLREAFPDNEETANLDIIFLAGDVFDRLLKLPQDEVEEIQSWISYMLDLCRKHDILLRILEGTPSHDWKQSKQFVNLNNGNGRAAKLKFVETLSIEIIQELGGLSILYVPDEWNHDAHTTWLQVNELLKLNGLEKVDVACMHGSFDYQLPIESVKNHNSEWYQSIVRHFITIGHVHIRSQRGIIFAQGSFDRLSHGEEAPKGHYRLTIGKRGNTSAFIENKGAKIYRTVDCRTMSVSDVFDFFDNIEDLPDRSQFRLMISRDAPLFHDMKEIRKRYPQFKIDTHLTELKVPEEILTKQLDEKIPQPITITPNNIKHLVEERVNRLVDFSSDPHNLQHLLLVLDKYKHKESA